MRLFMFSIGILTALVHPALAQITFPPAKPPSRIVTVLSDGLSEPDSPALQVLNEISVTLDKESGIRLLSVNAYGGPANVRDLLQLHGTDLAILNNDVLAYLDLAASLPEARRKVRLISPLFDQSVLLFARQDIKSIDDLRGRKIGIPASRPSRGVTARVVFGLLKIEVEFVELDRNAPSSRAGDLDAVFLYEKDLPSLRTFGVTSTSHHLLPITVAGPLAAVYLPKKLGKAAIAGFSSADAIETIQVAALLAGYDWSTKQSRYTDVVNFVENFFALVPKIRAHNPASPFSRTDVRTNSPGWKRFGPAEAYAATAQPASIKEDSLPLLKSSTEVFPSAGALKVIAVARPPLTNEQDKDGGVVLTILTGALNAVGVPISIQWVDTERELLDGLFTNKSADVGLFWQTPHCDTPGNQSAIEAELCDRAVLTDPLMQAVIAVFTRLDTPLATNSTDAVENRTVCVPKSQTLPDETLAAIPWIKTAKVKTLRPKTLIDCLAAVDQREAEALIAIEPEARFAIERLKLSQSFLISQRPGITTGLHVVVAKDNPSQAQLIQTINEALAKFRSSGGYSAVMASHLADLTGAPLKKN
jgi:ABC-type amino acid transport substrate-binding protein